MKNNKKKLSLKKSTISNLQLRQVTGGVKDSCIPTCNIEKSDRSICFPVVNGGPNKTFKTR
ncbi:class I lanthipeptide [Aquimarina longa]|uniref:class I lanthipeptide n=1 Tax=Aquimarina longa TaxID=1080221 RepID=UPI000785FCE6|nr:class I lanthipeptide [Aquimarina longa]